MKRVQIKLNQIESVKSFINVVTKFDADIDLMNGRYIIDAKSIMGVFSLDLSKTLDLVIHTEDDSVADAIVAKLKEVGVEVA